MIGVTEKYLGLAVMKIEGEAIPFDREAGAYTEREFEPWLRGTTQEKLSRVKAELREVVARRLWFEIPSESAAELLALLESLPNG